MHSSEEDPRVYPFKGFLKIQEEEGNRAFIQAFTFGGPSEITKIADQVQAGIVRRPAPPDPRLCVRQDAFLLDDEVQAGCDNPVHQFT